MEKIDVKVVDEDPFPSMALVNIASIDGRRISDMEEAQII